MSETTGCEHCVEGYITVDVPTEIYGGTPSAVPKCFACLCAQGQKHTRTKSIANVWPMETIERLWPQGAGPTDATIMEALAQANVPPAYHAWTLTSYRAKFTSKTMLEVTRRADAWLQTAVRDRSDWVLAGSHGTGKTGLAIALMRAAIEAGERVQFWTVRHLSIVWRAAYDQSLFERRQHTQREIELMEAILAPDVLVLDEFGGTTLTDFIEHTITDIIDSRQKQLRPTILTLNISDEDASDRKKLGQRIAAILGPTLTDRLRDRAQWVPLMGASQRKAWTMDRRTSEASV